MSHTRLKIRLLARLVDGTGGRNLDKIAALLHRNPALFEKCVRDGLDYANMFLRYNGRFQVRFEPKQKEQRT